ncbi:MAG: hypothetical protein HKL98_02990 [Burkholderiales bacterium]|nr:hypothetical protein [Burkholderiales bacterium]
MKKLYIALIGLTAVSASLPALAGPNWFVIYQERADQAKIYQSEARCICPKSESVSARHQGLNGMHATKKHILSEHNNS